jgi:hypothetical protein
MVLDLLVDTAELRISIPMLGAFQGLGVGLQTEPGRLQQPTHRRSRHRVTLPGQLPGQVPQRFRRPPQRRFRIRSRSSRRPGPPHTPRRDEQSGLGGHRQAPLPLVQVRQQHREPAAQLSPGLPHDRHTAPTTTMIQSNALIFYGFTRSGTGSGALPKSAHPGRRRPSQRSGTPRTIATLSTPSQRSRPPTARSSPRPSRSSATTSTNCSRSTTIPRALDPPADHESHRVDLRHRPHRTKITRGPGSRAAGLAMAFKLIEAAQDRWRAVNAPHLVALVRAGGVFEAGKLLERPDEPPTRSSLKDLHPQVLTIAPRDLRVRQAVCAEQHQPRPQRQTSPYRASPGQCLKLGPITLTQHRRRRSIGSPPLSAARPGPGDKCGRVLRDRRRSRPALLRCRAQGAGGWSAGRAVNQGHPAWRCDRRTHPRPCGARFAGVPADRPRRWLLPLGVWLCWPTPARSSPKLAARALSGRTITVLALLGHRRSDLRHRWRLHPGGRSWSAPVSRSLPWRPRHSPPPS